MTPKIARILSKLFCSILFSFFLLNSSYSAHSEPKVLMVVNTFEDGNSNLYLAVSYKTAPSWHTYWKNPGDAGIPTTINLELNGEPLELNGLEWPTPKRYIEKGLWTYGYDGAYSIFYPINEKLASKLHLGDLKVHSTWLACNNICIPEKSTVSGSFDKNRSIFSNPYSSDFYISKDELYRHFSSIPVRSLFPDKLEIKLFQTKNKDEFLLRTFLPSGSEIKNSMLNLLTPFPNDSFSFEHEKIYRDINDNLIGETLLSWQAPEFGSTFKKIDLKFLFNNLETGTVEVIEKNFSSADIIKDIVEIKTSSVVKKSSSFSHSFLYYILLALLGGLILNVMPCVLPIISIKLFGLMKSDRNKILKHNLTYSLGVLSSFAALATVVISLKASGEKIGWGFQLQSPVFLMFLILILIIFALNLFGLFQFKIIGSNFFGRVKLSKGFFGDFFSGVLATVLSTPCSAPFLGTALAFSLSSSPLTIFIIFISIGFGLSLPFLITGFFPRTVAFLPKPGPWMEHFKKFLGLSLIITAIWLIDIFIVLSFEEISSFWMNLSIGLSLLVFAIYVIKYVILNRTFVKILLALLIPMIFLGTIVFKELTYESNDPDRLTWNEWSVGKMEKCKQLQSYVFMHFTAKWCLTCKVNNEFVLNSGDFYDIAKSKNIKLLVGDWTKRDNDITKWLKSQDVVGVPAYFIQTPSGEIINLGEIISIDKIKKYFD